MPSDPLAADVGRRIRAKMGEQRVSVAELSRRTSRARSTLSHQINGGSLAVETLLLIAQALNVDPGEFLPELAKQSA